MNIPILPSKLNKPTPLEHQIRRESIKYKFNSHPKCDVILMSAPAGAGKSSVANEWLTEEKKLYIWYSLDEWDNDVQVFFSYIVEGLRQIDPNVFHQLSVLLDGYQSVGYNSFLRAMILALHQIEHDFILVLDDYHLIENSEIEGAIQKLIDHMPSQMKLTILTREDPNFPLSKYRVSNRLLEIRLSDLKFSEKETEEFLNLTLKATLSNSDLKKLFVRCEGWIAGLQLAVLSMKNRENYSRFIDEFTGNNFYIVDYLMDEVIEHLPIEVEDFLMKTSILEHFSVELCDAVIEGESSEFIKTLEDNNLFIISLDDERKWYRYHHLFRDLMRQRLGSGHHKVNTEEQNALHIRAGHWYHNHLQDKMAVHHYLQGNARSEATSLVECIWAKMDLNLQGGVWLNLAKQLSEDEINKRPVLVMAYGWALLDIGDFESCLVWLDRAKTMLETFDCHKDQYVISDERQFELMPATLESAYGYIAAGTGDLEGLFKHAYKSLELTPSDAYHKQGVIAMLLCFAHWSCGAFLEAEEVLYLALKNIEKEVNLLTLYSFKMVLGELFIQQGKLKEAKKVYQTNLNIIKRTEELPILLPSFYLGLAKVAFLQGESKTAYDALEKSKYYGQHFSFMDWRYKAYLLQARMYASEGLYDLASDCLMESQQSYFMNPIPEDVSLEQMSQYLKIKMDRTLDSELNAQEARVLENLIVPFSMLKSDSFKKEHVNQTLSEPLTIRELEVLELIGQGLSNKEICDRLFLALSTVKGYNQNIFGKLEVRRRTEAVSIAKQLGLIS